jgi:hypothetical protein
MMLYCPPGGVHEVTAPLRASTRVRWFVPISPTQTFPSASTEGCISPALGAT